MGVYRRQSPRIMVFKDHASKLLKFSRMAGDEYVPSEEDPDIIMATLVPIAMKIVQSHLGSSTFCDRFSTPLTSVARQVGDLMLVDHGCHDPAAVTAAILADVSHSKEAEEEIKQRLGVKTVKVWREVKLFL